MQFLLTITAFVCALFYGYAFYLNSDYSILFSLIEITLICLMFANREPNKQKVASEIVKSKTPNVNNNLLMNPVPANGLSPFQLSLDFKEDNKKPTEPTLEAPTAMTAEKLQSIVHQQLKTRLQKFSVEARPDLFKGQSHLQFIDQLCQSRPWLGQTLIITDIEDDRNARHTLKSHLYGLSSWNKVFCKRIFKDIDLIPGIGQVHSNDEMVLKNFIAHIHKDYDQVLFYVQKNKTPFFEELCRPFNVTPLTPTTITKPQPDIELNA